MYIQHSESDDNTHAFFKHLYPVWVLYSLRTWRTYVMKALQYCPAHLRRAQPVQQREPTLAFLEQSTSVICYHLAICTSPTCGEILWRKPRPSAPMSLAFSRNQPTSCFDTLVLMCRCWCAGCRVTPDESECVITFLCSRSFRLRSTSNEACILWEALEVAVSGDITEGKEEGREHLIPPPHTVLKPHVVCWWGKRFMR